jgi:hypothetical protein
VVLATNPAPSPNTGIADTLMRRSQPSDKRYAEVKKARCQRLDELQARVQIGLRWAPHGTHRRFPHPLSGAASPAGVGRPSK